MSESMTVRTEQSEIFQTGVAPVPVDVVNDENGRLIGISTAFANSIPQFQPKAAIIRPVPGLLIASLLESSAQRALADSVISGDGVLRLAMLNSPDSFSDVGVIHLRPRPSAALRGAIGARSVSQAEPVDESLPTMSADSLFLTLPVPRLLARRERATTVRHRTHYIKRMAKMSAAGRKRAARRRKGK